MNINLESIVESILFSVGEPISGAKLSKILGENKSLIDKAIGNLKDAYRKENRGLQIMEKGEKIQLVSNPKNSQYIEKLIKDELNEDLSPASLEVLAIISYKGPVTRSEIEEIRGVNCSFILRNLLIRGLIERKSHHEDGRAYIYEISFDFLRKLGLSSIEKLPNYKTFKK